MLTRVEDYGDTMLVVGDSICATIDKTDGSIAVEEATENLVTNKNVISYEGYNSVEKTNFGITMTTVQKDGYIVIRLEGLNQLGKTLSITGIMKKNGIPYFFEGLTSIYQQVAIEKEFNSNNGFFKIVQNYNDVNEWIFHFKVIAEIGDVISIEKFQIEEKSYCTSYVNGYRPAGIKKINVTHDFDKIIMIKIEKGTKTNSYIFDYVSKNAEIDNRIGAYVTDSGINIFRIINGLQYPNIVNLDSDTILIFFSKVKLYVYIGNTKVMECDVLPFNSLSQLFLGSRFSLEYQTDKKIDSLYFGNFSTSPFANPDGTPNEAYIQKVANSKGFLPNKGGKPSWLPEL